MATFLNTNAINYHLESLIKLASKRLVLISPFLKINEQLRNLIEDKQLNQMTIHLVYGKSALEQSERDWLKKQPLIQTSFCRNLHAKCYLNEYACIITSLNLYEFSQVNNYEMGVLLSRLEDSEAYDEALDESARILRASKKSVSNFSLSESLSSAQVAKNLNMTTQDFLRRMMHEGYLEQTSRGLRLTQQGIHIGGQRKKGVRGKYYFAWPLRVLQNQMSPIM